MHDLLAGIRVVDLTTVVLGPYATQILADFGAEVIKVEPIGGDVFRAARPGHSADMGAPFLGCNRNKQSIALDLRKDEAREVLHRLVRGADAVVHNMRPKSADKLGIGFEQLKAVRNDLVYCFAAGYGQAGRNRDEPAYDDSIQAASGFAALNADEGGSPRFAPTLIADKVGGLHLAIALLAGLASRNRDGQAVCIEAPMFESIVSFLLVEHMSGLSFDPPLGGAGYSRLLSPYRKPYRTADGWVGIIPYTAAHWERFLRLIGREELADSPLVNDPVERSRDIGTLYALIEQATPARTTSEWLALLRERDIPCAPVNMLEDLTANEHLLDVGMFRRQSHPTEGDLVAPRSPFSVDGDTGDADVPAPRLGEQSRSILDQLGYDAREAEALIASGAVAAFEGGAGGAGPE